MNCPPSAHSTRTGPPPLLGLMIRQFELHEMKHHERVDANDCGEVVMPRAHAIADIYKCLHQGEFGVGHNIRSPAHFGRQLNEEMSKADATSQEPVLEDVSLDGSVFRVNLGPYSKRFAGNDATGCALLLQVCLESAEQHRGEAERFLATLDEFRKLNKSHQVAVGDKIFAFPSDLVDAFLKEVAEFIESFGTIPVLSHSTVYKKLNSPSYRVVDRTSLENSALAFLLIGAE